MNKKKALARIKKLRKEIDQYRYQYHVLNQPSIEEEILDSLKHELAQLEKEFPSLVDPHSPTQRVAGKALDQFKKTAHDLPMLSLHDIFSHAELEEWDNRNHRLLPKEEFDYFAELKIDGVAVSLIYERGILVKGATRGDGKTGEDITFNIKTIPSLPLQIWKPGIPEKIEVRGEIFMPLQAFEKLNNQRKQQGKDPFANPRNATAGSVRQLDPQIANSRPLDCFLYTISQGITKEKTHQDLHQTLKNWGFKTNPFSKLCHSLEEIQNFWEKMTQKRGDFPYLVDGIVISVNSLEQEKALGVVGKGPRWSIAYKFPAEKATSVIEDIQIQVGRQGTLTPVAYLKPTPVAGTTVSRASLHNLDEIRKKDIRIGDTVIIQKAGDIIPHVLKVLKNFRSGEEKKFVMPRNCPLCNTKIEKSPDKVAYYCPNLNCPGRLRERLTYLTSRNAFNIEGFGESLAEQLISRNLVKTIADIFFLTPAQLKELDLFAEKKAQKVYQAIQNSKIIPLLNFLYALGIPLMGEETIKLIIPLLLEKKKMSLNSPKTDLQIPLFTDKKLLSPLQLFALCQRISIDDLLQIKGIGEEIAQSFISFFLNKKTEKIFRQFQKAQIQILLPSPKQNSALQAKTFVLTGTLEKYTRKEAKNELEKLGAKVTGSISSNTDYLIVGENPGSKLAQAQKFSVDILSEKEFIKLINNKGEIK